MSDQQHEDTPWGKAHAAEAENVIAELGDRRVGTGSWIYAEGLLSAVGDPTALEHELVEAGEDAPRVLALIRARVQKRGRPSEIAPGDHVAAFRDIAAERARHVAKGRGPELDDARLDSDWFACLDLVRARHASAGRALWVKVGSIAVAAIEALDRQEAARQERQHLAAVRR